MEKVDGDVRVFDLSTVFINGKVIGPSIERVQQKHARWAYSASGGVSPFFAVTPIFVEGNDANRKKFE